MIFSKEQHALWRIASLWNQHFSETSPRADMRHFSFPEKRFQRVSNFSPSLSENAVFEGERGLLQWQWKWEKSGRPLFLCDNHHGILFPLFALSHFFQKPITLVHIDAHRDDAVFPFPVSPHETAENLFQKCRVSDYRDAAQRAGKGGKTFCVTQSFEFENFSVPVENFVLNLDFDIFGEEGSCVHTETKLRVIAAAWQKSDAVFLATSPGFCDQEFIFRILKILETTQ